jgi:hypothetical protein
MRIPFLALTCLAAASAHAQRAAYLMPESFLVEPGSPAVVHLAEGRAGQGLGRVDWPAGRVPWLFVRGGSGHWNFHDAAPADGPGLELAVPPVGAVMIGLDLDPEVVEFGRAELEAFLDRFVADAPELPAGDGPVRVRLVRSATTLLRIADGVTEGEYSPVAVAKTGQLAELRPYMDPTIVHVGGDLSLRLYAGSSSIVGGRLLATPSRPGGDGDDGRQERAGDGPVLEAVAQTVGLASFTITEPGVWRAEFYHAVSPPQPGPHARPEAVGDGEQVGLVLYSGSLTFRVPDRENRP